VIRQGNEFPLRYIAAPRYQFVIRVLACELVVAWEKLFKSAVTPEKCVIGERFTEDKAKNAKWFARNKCNGKLESVYLQQHATVERIESVHLLISLVPASDISPLLDVMDGDRRNEGRLPWMFGVSDASDLNMLIRHV